MRFHLAPAGGSLGVLPAPAGLASLQLPTIPAKEAETSTQGVSEALGNPSGEGASSAPVMKAGTSHNPEKGKQSAQGKAKQPAQGETPTDTPFSLGRVTLSAGQAGQEDPPGGVCGHGWPPQRQRRGRAAARGGHRQHHLHRGAGKAKRREIPDLLSWVQCFGVGGKPAPQKNPRIDGLPDNNHPGGPALRGSRLEGLRQHVPPTRRQPAQHRLVEGEQLSVCLHLHGSAKRSGKDLRAVPGTRPCGGRVCPGPAKPSEPPPPRQPAGLGGMPTGQRCASTSREWRPREEYNGPRGQAANRPPGDRQERVCYSWNDCTCRFINCRYRHECDRCGGEHRASTLVHW